MKQEANRPSPPFPNAISFFSTSATSSNEKDNSSKSSSAVSSNPPLNSVDYFSTVFQVKIRSRNNTDPVSAVQRADFFVSGSNHSRSSS